MNREIKFRVRRLDAKYIVAVEWYDKTAGWLHYLENNPTEIILGVYDSSDFGWANNDTHIHEQFTGLKDKNGKEVYEGDILKLYEGHPYWLSMNFRVVFNEAAFCLQPVGYRLRESEKPTAFTTYSDACEKNGLENDCTKYVEIIGNIYEHSHLLNTDKESI